MLSSQGKGFAVALVLSNTETHKSGDKGLRLTQVTLNLGWGKAAVPAGALLGNPRPSPAWAFRSFYFTFTPFILFPSPKRAHRVRLTALGWGCTEHNSGETQQPDISSCCLGAVEFNTKMKITGPPQRLAHLMWARSAIVANFGANPLYFSSTDEQTRLFFVLRNCSIY